MTLAEIQITR